MEVREPAVLYGKKKFSIEEYVKMQSEVGEKYEYFNGEIFAMAWASPLHNLISGNVFGEFFSQLKHSSFRTFGSDMRIHIPKNTLFTYPDISVFCGDLKSPDFDENSLINPTVII